MYVIGYQKSSIHEKSSWVPAYVVVGKFPVRELLRGAYDEFPDFFRMGTSIDSTRMKL